MNILDILILIAIAVALWLAFRHNRKKGGCCGGCSGNCAQCPSRTGCSLPQKNEKIDK